MAARRLPCDTVTPFGAPVEPEVYVICAGSIGTRGTTANVAARGHVADVEHAAGDFEGPGLALEHGRVGEQCRGARIPQHVLDLAGAQRFVDDDGDGTGCEHAEERSHCVRAAIEKQPHAVARPHAGAGQRSRHAGGPRVQASIRACTRSIDHRDPVGVRRPPCQTTAARLAGGNSSVIECPRRSWRTQPPAVPMRGV